MYDTSIGEMRGEQLRKNNQDVQDFIDSAHVALRAKGWKYEGQRLRSALYEREYKKDGQSVCISGWHGTGKRGTCRWFGDGKSFFDFGYYKGLTRLHHVGCPSTHKTMGIAISKQAEAMEEAINFIKGL